VEGEWVSIARLGKTRGLKGEIYGYGDLGPERYAAIPEVWLRDAKGAMPLDGRSLSIESVHEYKGGLVFRFRGIESIEAAEPLEQGELVIRKSDRPPASEGEFYFADLTGCEVIDRRSGSLVGVVAGWQEYGGPVLLEVRPEGRSGVVWVPFARSICVEIDPAAKRIVIDPPEGLLELNEGVG
jgi:16S rRNA processing protein RimM